MLCGFLKSCMWCDLEYVYDFHGFVIFLWIGKTILQHGMWFLLCSNLFQTLSAHLPNNCVAPRKKNTLKPLTWAPGLGPNPRQADKLHILNIIQNIVLRLFWISAQHSRITQLDNSTTLADTTNCHAQSSVHCPLSSVRPLLVASLTGTRRRMPWLLLLLVA